MEGKVDTIEAMVAGVGTLFDEYDAATLERVQQSLLKRRNQVLRALGGNNLEVEQGGVASRQISGRLKFALCMTGGIR